MVRRESLNGVQRTISRNGSESRPMSRSSVVIRPPSRQGLEDLRTTGRPSRVTYERPPSRGIQVLERPPSQGGRASSVIQVSRPSSRVSVNGN